LPQIKSTFYCGFVVLVLGLFVLFVSGWFVAGADVRVSTVSVEECEKKNQPSRRAKTAPTASGSTVEVPVALARLGEIGSRFAIKFDLLEEVI
jgi:hypothetical protein